MALNPYVEVSEAIREVGSATFDKCFQCGTCTGACPWNLTGEFSPRLLFRQAQLGTEGYESDALWRCVNCQQCVVLCPRGVEITDVIAGVRHLVGEGGRFPRSLQSMLASAKTRGNPWSVPASERAVWAEAAGVPRYTAAMDYLYWACCTPQLGTRTRGAALGMAAIFEAAGASFGVLAEDEVCCGISMREVGAHALNEELAARNIATFERAGVSEIIVQSPHCLEAFNKLYPEQGAELDVEHYTVWLDRALAVGRLAPARTLEGRRVVYHDSCYLGRRNEIYQPPRRILKRLGADLIEFDRNRKHGLCCGGGGGHMWMDTPPHERFVSLRVEEAERKGAEIIAVACPFCFIMYADALLAHGGDIEVADIAELVHHGIA